MGPGRGIKLLVLPPYLPPVLLLAVIICLAASKLFPPSCPASLYYGHPLEGLSVVVDPGHGGIDPGVHYNDTLTEREVSLAVGLELRRLLERSGAEAIMTRETEGDVSHHLPESAGSRYWRDVEGRIKIINESGAELFISLHLDSIYDPDVRGAIVFYCGSRPESKALAETIQRNINPVVAGEPGPGQYIHQQIKVGDYKILNRAEIPGVIVEMGFMTSPDDRALLEQEAYRKRLARAVFLGIVEYVYGR